MNKTELQKLWETRLSEFKASGKSVKEWCAVQDHVTPRQVWYWLSKFKDQNELSFAKSTQWLPVEINEQSALEHDNFLL
ncbi:MAG: helix-turn-helix domain-containing protein, partial [Syntrophomonadaceae bacterium]|nr:helix-turn-helix domain-containing protein [Syntrophomonadaceae bacterium]